MFNMIFEKGTFYLLLGIILTKYALVAGIVTCEYEWLGDYYTRECRDGFECCNENYDCCKIPHNPEEYLNTGVLIGAILGCVLLVFVVVSLVVWLKCGAKKRIQRMMTRRSRNAVANLTRVPGTDIQLPPPYESSGYAPPPPYRGSSNNTQGDLPFLGYAPPTYTANAINAQGQGNMPVYTI